MVQSGLSEGEQIVLQGGSRLTDGAKVSIVSSKSSSRAETAQAGHHNHHHGSATANAAQPT